MKVHVEPDGMSMPLDDTEGPFPEPAFPEPAPTDEKALTEALALFICHCTEQRIFEHLPVMPTERRHTKAKELFELGKTLLAREVPKDGSGKEEQQ